MATFRRGAEAIQAAATRSGGGKFTPTFKFEAGETKYLQFLTGIDDIPTVLMHRFVIVGHREDGNPIYENFISRRDSALDGPDGYDPLIDRFGLQPTQRCVALAVELEPQWSSGSGSRKTIKGFDVATRQFTTKDDETKEVPNVALVIESPYTFFQPITTLADMGENVEEAIFAVKRTGKQTDTSYTFLRVGDAIDLEEELDEFFEEFDFDKWLEDLADEDRIHDLIDELPDNFVVSKFAKKAKGKKDEGKEEKKETSTRTRRTRTEEPEPEAEAEAEADGDEADEEEAAPAGRRSRKFSELKRDRSR